MKRALRTILSLLAVLALLMTAGCGTGTSGGTQATSGSSAAGTGAVSGTENQEDLKTAKYDPPVEVTFVRSTDDLIERVLSNTGGETLDNNRYTQLIEDTYGIKVKYLWISKGWEEYVQKLNLSLASGDLPDFIPFANLSQVKQAIDAGYVQDAKPAFDKYASDLTREIYESDLGVSTEAATFDGILGGVPEIKPSYDTVPELFIRKDWLDNLGLAEPKNHADVLKIMEAFAKQDPDQNGKNDTFGFAVVKDMWTNLGDMRGFFAAYHAYPDAWYEDASGKLVYGSVQPEMKAGLEKLREMYAQGLLDKEFGVKNESQVAEDVAAGKIGLTYHKDWGPFWPLNISHNNDNKAMWYCYPLLSNDDKQARPVMYSGTTSWMGINARAKNPEAVIKILNLYCEKNWGETAEADKFFGSGESEGLWKLSPISILHPYNNFIILDGVKKAISSGSSQDIPSNAKSMYDSIMKYRNGDHANWSFEAVYAPESYNSISVTEVYRSQNLPLLAKWTWTRAAEDKDAACKKVLLDAFVKIIIGEKDISEFDNAVDQWKKLGGDDISKELNEWYAKSK